MAAIIIESAGMLSTIQDSGRVGYQRFGMPVAGAMDLFSLQLANILVGNQPNSAAIEATLTGPAIVFTADGYIAICGADMQPCINGKPIAIYQTVRVDSGDKLTFFGLNYGCRAYIAFAGGLDVPPVMGSRSTYVRARIGGLEGRALKSVDTIPLGRILIKPMLKKIPESMIPDYKSDRPVRIIAGPEINMLDLEGARAFLTNEYKITEQSDRMGFRLSGPPIQINSSVSGIISTGISPGTIQLPGNGQPIILMADRQTTGGYARIANVISTDLTRVAQLKPGDKIRFAEISIEEAQEEIRERQELLKSI